MGRCDSDRHVGTYLVPTARLPTPPFICKSRDAAAVTLDEMLEDSNIVQLLYIDIVFASDLPCFVS